MDIMVVEDDGDIREMVCQSLAQNDFRPVGCRDLHEARRLLAKITPDCFIIDWMLPDGSGIDLVRWIRRQDALQQIPVLMLTARSAESDLITGLDSGADDYLTKPMSLRELNARVRALVRRPPSYEEARDLLSAGRLRVNTQTHEVFVDDALLEVSRTEFKLLRLFIENPNKVFSREQILDAVWGLNSVRGERTVDVHILRLRKLLKPYGAADMITTVRGSGYRLSKNTSQQR